MSTVVPVLAHLAIQIGFHPSKICCIGCPLCIDDAWSRGRKRCVVTNEIILCPEQLGMRCPLKFEEAKPNE